MGHALPPKEILTCLAAIHGKSTVDDKNTLASP